MPFKTRLTTNQRKIGCATEFPQLHESETYYDESSHEQFEYPLPLRTIAIANESNRTTIHYDFVQ